ncbi:MAG TPA: nucleotidyltransferase family protein, partial [Planctomycetota bacterium]|nr:nucleotidyltransferase family protein [Planctomycetota bacterium]
MIPPPDPERRHRFYRRVLHALADERLPFLVGGAYAMRRYADVRRDTRDLDLFLEPGQAGRAVRLLQRRGFEAGIVSPHWLGKVLERGDTVDLIFRSRNGLCAVDPDWFRHSRSGRVLGVPIRWVPPEEMLWSKSFVMARERFDGADVGQLIRARGRSLDWRRLLDRFGAQWEVLFAQVVLFDFTFPSERASVPAWVR